MRGGGLNLKPKRLTRPRQTKRYTESDKELWSILSSSLEKKRSIKRKRHMDFYRAAVLEFSLQRLNDEITERCNRKSKRRKSDAYEWHDGSNGVGWNMKSSRQDDDDLLGIDDFFRKLSKCKPENGSVSSETDLCLSNEISEMDISSSKAKES